MSFFDEIMKKFVFILLIISSLTCSGCQMAQTLNETSEMLDGIKRVKSHF